MNRTVEGILRTSAAFALAACTTGSARPLEQPTSIPKSTEKPPATLQLPTAEPTKTTVPTKEIIATVTPEPGTGGELPRVVAFRENILKQMLERSHPLYGANSPLQLRAEDEDAPLGKAGWKIILKGEGFVGVQEYDEKGVSKGRVLTGESKSKPGDPELITAVEFVPSDLVNQPYVVVAGKNLEWKNGTWYREGNLSLGQSAKQLLLRDKMTWVNESDPATPTVVPTAKPFVTPGTIITKEPKATPSIKPTEKAPINNTSGLVSGSYYNKESLDALVKYWGNIKTDGAFAYNEEGVQFINPSGLPYILPSGTNVEVLFEVGGYSWVVEINSRTAGAVQVLRIPTSRVTRR